MASSMLLHQAVRASRSSVSSMMKWSSSSSLLLRSTSKKRGRFDHMIHSPHYDKNNASVLAVSVAVATCYVVLEEPLLFASSSPTMTKSSCETNNLIERLDRQQHPVQQRPNQQVCATSAHMAAPSTDLATTRHGMALLFDWLSSPPYDLGSKNDEEEQRKDDTTTVPPPIVDVTPTVTTRLPTTQQSKITSLTATLIESNSRINLGTDGSMDSATTTAVELNSDQPTAIDNDHFQGKLRLMVKPVRDEDDPHFVQNLANHDDDNDDPTNRSNVRFEFQLQGVSRRCPDDSISNDDASNTSSPAPLHQVYMGAQTKAISLNRVTRPLATLLLRLLAMKLGPEMEYSFGNRETKAFLSFPIHTAMEHVVLTPAGQSPPVMGTSFADQQQKLDAVAASKRRFHQHDSNKNVMKEKEQHQTATEINNKSSNHMVYSMSFSASCMHLAAWQIVAPLSISLSRFWGTSPVWLVIYEQQQPPHQDHHKDPKTSRDPTTASSTRNYWMQLEIQHEDNNRN